MNKTRKSDKIGRSEYRNIGESDFLVFRSSDLPNPMLPDKLAFVDIETTGCSLNYDRVIEIGIVRVENGKEVKRFSTLINPQKYIPEEITRLTGIVSGDVENSPTFREVKDEILELIEGCYFVAHNVRFDYAFLKQEFKRLGISFSPKHFCTVKLSQNLYPQYRHHNLDSVIERFGFQCQKRHRALDDAAVLWDFYQMALKNFSEGYLQTILNKLLKKPSVPIKISEETLDALPETPGVYIFYGSNGMPLYIGKSVNIKHRVKSHFSNDHMASTEMKISQQIEHIETITTKGELGALLKESLLIKKMQPLYNRRLRNAPKMIVLLEKGEMSEFKKVEFCGSEALDPENLSLVLGVHRSKANAKKQLEKMADEYGLCKKLLGLENLDKACFGYRLGKCDGACMGQGSALKYNLRFMQAFDLYKLKRWPYEGPIIIREDESVSTKQGGFLIDKWCFLGEIKGDTDLQEVQFLKDDITFDLDTYKIISSFLRSPKNKKKIQVLTKKNSSYQPLFGEQLSLTQP